MWEKIYHNQRKGKYMAGLDNNMLSVIECLAKNKIQDAKNAAIVCCKNDTTKKNAANLNYYQKLLENGNSTFMDIHMRYIGNTLKRRMDMLEINAATLAEMTFMDECLIRNIINNKIPYEKIDKFDMALICNLLHCDEQYFAHPNIHNDFLDRVFDKEKDSHTSMKVKIKIRDFLSDFMFVNEVLSDEQKKNFICEK